jgi:hypothetical protein
MSQVHLFDDVVELFSLQHLKGIPVDVQYFIRFYLGMTALHQTLVTGFGLRILCEMPILLSV